MFTMRISVPRNYQPRGRRYGNFNNAHASATKPNSADSGGNSQPLEGQNNEIRETVMVPQIV